ncbi:hypothetical protein [Effusibacillus pohliae]|uniref:hypothetical protein n=1 Tax=Effusibacillus pohliae TaxID=232270 RepID=UPI0003617784|nr:hypothetical protein [Effusibacillus pohliae]
MYGFWVKIRRSLHRAARARVQKLCLIHIYPGYDQEPKREAATAFAGEILVAEKGMVLEV